MPALSIGVLVSGQGSNLRALQRACAEGIIPARIALVVSNRAACPAISFAREAGLQTEILAQRDHGGAQARDAVMAGRLAAAGVQLVVNAGYDRWLTAPLLQRYPGRIINVHPSLLPAFAGTLNAIDEAHAHGVKVTGVTVHIVDESQDGGPIVLQEPVPVLEADSVQDLAERIHTVEHRLLPEAVRLFAENRVRVVGRRVEIHDAPVAVPT